jgi:hypothetical protein
MGRPFLYACALLSVCFGHAQEPNCPDFRKVESIAVERYLTSTSYDAKPECVVKALDAVNGRGLRVSAESLGKHLLAMRTEWEGVFLLDNESVTHFYPAVLALSRGGDSAMKWLLGHAVGAENGAQSRRMATRAMYLIETKGGGSALTLLQRVEQITTANNCSKATLQMSGWLVGWCASEVLHECRLLHQRICSESQ